MVIGTVGYMSPEQVRGAEADHRSDIFAFGAILYEMIAGRQAFHGASAVETMNAILREEPADLSDAEQWRGRPRLGTDRPPLSGEEPRVALPGGSRPGVRAPGGVSNATPAVRSATETEVRWTSMADRGATRQSPPDAGWRSLPRRCSLSRCWSASTGGLVNRREPLILGEATTEQITFNPAEEPIFLAAISPDNKWLAYADLGGVHLRQNDTGETHLLPVPEGFCFRCPNLTWFHNSTKLLASGPAGPDQANSIWSISIVGANCASSGTMPRMPRRLPTDRWWHSSRRTTAKSG